MPTCNSTPPSSPDTEVKSDLLRALPKLRVFALSLCRRSRDSAERADDLVQETVARALANINSFTPGSNMIGWLCTILRNDFYSRHRRHRHEIQDESGLFASKLLSPPEQEGHMSFLELQNAMQQLRPEHRQALILVGASGFSYEDAAPLCACAIGTVKSRVNRARAKLAELLEVPNHYVESHVTRFDTSALRDDDHRQSGSDYSAVGARQKQDRSSSFANAG